MTETTRVWLPLVIPSSSDRVHTEVEGSIYCGSKAGCKQFFGFIQPENIYSNRSENGRDEFTESCTTPVSWKLVPATTVVGVDGSNTTELITCTVTFAIVSLPV